MEYISLRSEQMAALRGEVVLCRFQPVWLQPNMTNRLWYRMEGFQQCFFEHRILNWDAKRRLVFFFFLRHTTPEAEKRCHYAYYTFMYGIGSVWELNIKPELTNVMYPPHIIFYAFNKSVPVDSVNRIPKTHRIRFFYWIYKISQNIPKDEQSHNLRIIILPLQKKKKKEKKWRHSKVRVEKFDFIQSRPLLSWILPDHKLMRKIFGMISWKFILESQMRPAQKWAKQKMNRTTIPSAFSIVCLHWI